MFKFDWSKKGTETDEGKEVYKAAVAEFRGEKPAPKPLEVVVVPECEEYSKAKDLLGKLLGSDTAAVASEAECVDLLRIAILSGGIKHPRLEDEIVEFLLALEEEPILVEFENAPEWIEAETEVGTVRASVNAKYDWLEEMGYELDQHFAIGLLLDGANDAKVLAYRHIPWPTEPRVGELVNGNEFSLMVINGTPIGKVQFVDCLVQAGGYAVTSAVWREQTTLLGDFEKAKDVIEIDRPMHAIPVPITIDQSEFCEHCGTAAPCTSYDCRDYAMGKNGYEDVIEHLEFEDYIQETAWTVKEATVMEHAYAQEAIAEIESPTVACKHCGGQIGEDFVFCDICGRPTENAKGKHVSPDRAKEIWARLNPPSPRPSDQAGEEGPITITEKVAAKVKEVKAETKTAKAKADELTTIYDWLHNHASRDEHGRYHFEKGYSIRLVWRPGTLREGFIDHLRKSIRKVDDYFKACAFQFVGPTS